MWDLNSRPRDRVSHWASQVPLHSSLWVTSGRTYIAVCARQVLSTLHIITPLVLTTVLCDNTIIVVISPIFQLRKLSRKVDFPEHKLGFETGGWLQSLCSYPPCSFACYFAIAHPTYTYLWLSWRGNSVKMSVLFWDKCRTYMGPPTDTEASSCKAWLCLNTNMAAFHRVLAVCQAGPVCEAHGYLIMMTLNRWTR